MKKTYGWHELFFKNSAGQALAELLIAVGIGALVLGSSAMIIRTITLSNSGVLKSRTSTDLGRELMDNVRSFADSNWRDFYDLSNGSSNHYYLNATSTPFTPVAGDETITLSGIDFNRYFYLEDVNRSIATDEVATSGGVPDPSTQKIVVKVEWDGNEGVTLTEFFSRHRNFTFRQSDWTGGVDNSGTFGSSNNLYAAISNISTTTVEQITLESVGSGGTLESVTFDMGATDRGVLNFIIWQGTQPNGTAVRFQLASSENTDGPWVYVGSDGTGTSYYTPSGPGTSVIVRQANHLHQRYFRYKLFLDPDSGNTLTPTVEDVIVNFSR